MTALAETTRSLMFERRMPHPPEKIWRALTQPWLIAEWLMQNDFAATVGHRLGAAFLTAPRSIATNFPSTRSDLAFAYETKSAARISMLPASAPSRSMAAPRV